MLDAVLVGGHPLRTRRAPARRDLAGACCGGWPVCLPAAEAGCPAAANTGAGAGALAARLGRVPALVAGGAGAEPALGAVRSQHAAQSKQWRALAADYDQGHVS